MGERSADCLVVEIIPAYYLLSHQFIILFGEMENQNNLDGITLSKLWKPPY